MTVLSHEEGAVLFAKMIILIKGDHGVLFASSENNLLHCYHNFPLEVVSHPHYDGKFANLSLLIICDFELIGTNLQHIPNLYLIFHPISNLQKAPCFLKWNIIIRNSSSIQINHCMLPTNTLLS